VRFVFVYEPGETAVFARDIVPMPVIGLGDADNPVPAATLVTPLPPLVAEMVILPRPSSTIVTFGPSTRFKRF
jgi:hypothetical protein